MNNNPENAENEFRVPEIPKKKRSKSPLKSVNRSDDKVGNNDIESKRAAMLERLEKRRSVNIAKWNQEKNLQEKPSTISFQDTEKSFVEQTFCEPSRPSFSDISCITGTDTFIVTTPSRKVSGPHCSTPFRTNKSPQNAFSPGTPLRSQLDYESQEEVTDRQFNALAVWCNMLLNTCNRFDDKILDLGQTKQEANKMLQEYLTKQGKEQQISCVPEKFNIKDFFRAQEFNVILHRASQVFHSCDIPEKIESMIKKEVVTIREDSCVYSDITLKMKLLQVFLSFHPVWLHLGMEIVFNRTIAIPDEKSFLGTMSSFINTYLFSDPQIMKQKKYAIGTVKLLVTKEGRQALHRHFLVKTCQFLYCVEQCKQARIIQSDPRLFARKSQFKSLSDVFSEFSREILSASSTTLSKAFSKIGFNPSYKQTYFDDFDYKVEKPADITDGVNLGKLVEIACNLKRGAVMGTLRNPGGDRLRKIGNVTSVLKIASSSGVDIGGVKPEAVVGGNKETILEVLWRIIGVFVLSSGNSEELRRESLRLHFNDGTLSIEKTSAEEYLLRICQNLGINFGVEIRSLEDLRDGVFLSMAWREYNIAADDVHFFKGKTLFKKVVNAAETELDVPVGLHGSLPLFIHMYLTRLFAIRRVYDAAIVIQRSYRAYRNSKTMMAQLKERIITLKAQKKAEEEKSKKEREELLKSVVIIQSLIRRFIAKRKLQELMDEKKRMLEAEKEAQMLKMKEESAIILQKSWRGYKDRKMFEILRIEKDQKIKVLKSAILIQSAFRRSLAMKKLQGLISEKNRKLQAEKEAKMLKIKEEKAIILQKSWRGYRDRKIYENLKTEKAQKLKLLKSAILIQSAFRRLLAMKKLQGLISEKNRKLQAEKEAKMLKIKEEKATVLQKSWRGYRARKIYENLKTDKIQKLKVLNSAILIQSAFRRSLAMKRLQGLISEKNRQIEMERLEREAEIQKTKEKKAIDLQRFWRGYKARMILESLQAEKAHETKRQESILLIQNSFRRFQAIKRLQSLIMEKNKQLEVERKVITVQSRVRGFLARRRVNQMATKEIEDLERSIVIASPTSPYRRYSFSIQQNVPTTPELLTTLRRLRNDVSKIKQFNAHCESVLDNIKSMNINKEATKKDKALEVFEISEKDFPPTANEEENVRCVPEPSEKDKKLAAEFIQRWWRGYSSRKRMQEDIDKRKKAMSDYKQSIAKNDSLYDTFQEKRPVYEKLHEWTEWLFEKSLYRTKVAAISIDRVIQLASMVAKYFIFECNGLTAVLDRMEQTDRSPGEEEIMTSLTSILRRIIENAATDTKIRTFVLQYKADCLKILFHFTNAYHGNSSIVLTSAQALEGLKKLSADVTYEKARFFISQAEKRYKRLPQEDPKCTAIKILRDNFQ